MMKVLVTPYARRFGVEQRVRFQPLACPIEGEQRFLETCVTRAWRSRRCWSARRRLSDRGELRFGKRDLWHART